MILTSLIVYGIAFGILSTIVANNKKRDGFKWFLIGFLFGIFGFLAILIVDKREETQNLNSKNKNEFNPSNFDKKCPDCAEYIKLEAKVCRYCNYRFAEEAVEKDIVAKRTHFLEENQSSNTPKNQKISCENCYSFNDPKAEHCHNCGKRLS